MTHDAQIYTAFDGYTLLAQGSLSDVVLQVKRRIDTNPEATILVFSDLTGKEMDFDLRGTEEDVLRRLHIYASPEAAVLENGGPGRPKLGVISREVLLLPRHWEWLSTQSGGASAALRRLVENAKKTSVSKDVVRNAQARTHQFMSSIAGNFPRFEAALRALYAQDQAAFDAQTLDWPEGIRGHIQQLAAPVFDPIGLPKFL